MDYSKSTLTISWNYYSSLVINDTWKAEQNRGCKQISGPNYGNLELYGTGRPPKHLIRDTFDCIWWTWVFGLKTKSIMWPRNFWKIWTLPPSQVSSDATVYLAHPLSFGHPFIWFLHVSLPGPSTFLPFFNMQFTPTHPLLFHSSKYNLMTSSPQRDCKLCLNHCVGVWGVKYTKHKND